MSLRQITLAIRRYKPGLIDPPRLMTYTLEIQGDPSVLDCLERIRLEQEPGLMYRHCCHHASCGTCGCRIDGVERLACVTRISDLVDPGDQADPSAPSDHTVTVEPLAGLPVAGDLVVEQAPFYADLPPDWDGLRPSERGEDQELPDGIDELTRLEDCIECACCWSVCPVTGDDLPFLGPAALAALSRELDKHPEREAELLEIASGERGVSLCERSIDCSRRCPTGVAPARHIALLRRRIRG